MDWRKSTSIVKVAGRFNLSTGHRLYNTNNEGTMKKVDQLQKLKEIKPRTSVPGHGLTTMARAATDLANLKRQDQGNHECEVLAGEDEGALLWEKGTKNPGHEGFIPAPEFSIDHLPGENRDEQVYQYIRCMMDLTLRIIVKRVSVDRPNKYAFSNFKTQEIAHAGSGIVKHSCVPHKSDTCPCSRCEKSGNPEKKWWEFIVMTAKHVVFNTEEARNAVIELYYDDENRDTVKYLYGVDVFDENTDGDRCEFRCVTHDAKVADEIKNAEDMSHAMRDTFNKKYNPTLIEEEANMCVVISHPHGLSKRVSIGHWKEGFTQRKDTVGDSPYWPRTYKAYTHNAHTCKGSSGGCTIIMNLRDACWTNKYPMYYICYTHCCGEINCNGQNENSTCFWPTHVDE